MHVCMAQVNVINKIPLDFPSVMGGISIHWHGLDMHNEASWYDGVPYVGKFVGQADSSTRVAFLTHPFVYHGHW